MLEVLLFPMLFRRKVQNGTRSVKMTRGVPQDDPPSSLLFKIFMNDYLFQTNVGPDRVTTCFADDVLLLASSSERLQ